MKKKEPIKKEIYLGKDKDGIDIYDINGVCPDLSKNETFKVYIH